MSVKFDKTGFLEQIQIDQSKLTAEMADQAATYSHYGLMKVQAEDEEARRKLEREAMEAQLDKKFRADLGDKATEKAIEKEIKRSKEYTAAEVAYLNAKYATAMLNVAVEAFEMRARMLSSIGAIVREEMSQQFVGTPVASRAGSTLDAASAKLAERVKRKLSNG